MRDRTDKKATPEQVRELANTIALQAEAIANDRVRGTVFGATWLLYQNAETLHHWTRDDRQYS